MPRGSITRLRSFKPNDKIPGGSKKGKPQNHWPIGIKVIAEAIYRRAAGGMEYLLQNKDWASAGIDTNGYLLKRELAKLCPGIWDWVENNFVPTKDAPWANLHNRVYKMYYSGSSDRGSNHDPKTRASISREHWTNKVPVGHNLYGVHDQVDRGIVQVIFDWHRKILDVK